MVAKMCTEIICLHLAHSARLSSVGVSLLLFSERKEGKCCSIAVVDAQRKQTIDRSTGKTAENAVCVCASFWLA